VNYDPHQHAEALGLRVGYQALRSAPGLYIPDERLIILRPRMRVATERTVLAHEIQHHLAAHVPLAPGVWSRRQEHRADIGAARALITERALRYSMACSPDAAAWATDLAVTGDMLQVYLRHCIPLAAVS
jgi:Zn-dependent peptidase ImmA (M78 family)